MIFKTNDLNLEGQNISISIFQFHYTLPDQTKCCSRSKARLRTGDESIRSHNKNFRVEYEGNLDSYIFTRLKAPSRVPLPSFLLISNMVMVVAIMSLCFVANLYLKVKLKATSQMSVTQPQRRRRRNNQKYNLDNIF